MRPEARRAAAADASRNDETEGEVEGSRQRRGEPLKRIGATDAGTETPHASAKRSEPLAVCVERAVEAYFDDLDGEPAMDLYALVLDEVEAPLLRAVLRRTDGNQSRAAEFLGLSRGTLRKKLKQHGLL